MDQYKVNFDDTTVSDFMRYKQSEELCRYLVSIGMPIGNMAIGMAVNNNYTDNFLQLLLEKGGTLNNWALQTAAQKKRWVLFPELINKSTDDNINYRQTREEYTTWYNSQTADYRSKNPFKYDPTESKTALMFAAQYGQMRLVRLLVEKGAKVNLRADGGKTAASLAYDNGEIEVYNYLKANGARDFEPRQVTQQPAAPAQSTTNVYVQPSAPASSSSSTPSKNIGKEIADAFKSPLQSGTYSLVGSQEKISLVGIAKSGVITQTWQGKSYQGTYNIDGNKMTVQIRGYTFVFNITSETSFSGHNETWVRTGF